MIQTIDIRCPHCGQDSQIFLSMAVNIIILNCPDCRSPIMFFKNKIFLLDHAQMEKITGAKRTATVLKYLEEVAATAAPARRKEGAGACLVHSARPEPLSSSWKRSDEGRCITEDDITNLRIELALCGDVREFLVRI